MLATERLFLIPTTVPLLDAIVNEDWATLAARLGSVGYADNWLHFPEAYLWLRDYLREHDDAPAWWSYLIVHRHDVRLIGTCGFKGAPDPRGSVEVGYEIADAYQNRGFATETARALCDFAFAQPGVHVVTAQTLAEENASVNVLRKLGFTFMQEKTDLEDGKIWEWERRREQEKAGE